VPLIVKWPGKTKAGLVLDEPVISNDLYPTCLAACGLPALPNQHVDGLDLSQLIQGKATSLNRQSLFWHFPHYNEHPSSLPSSVIRKGAWKLIETFDPAGLELYNLEQDLSEATNLATSNPEKLAELRGELEAWRVDVGAEMMRPNPDYDPASTATPKKKKGSGLRQKSLAP
jgi:arylsulfatase A-like enzyme